MQIITKSRDLLTRFLADDNFTWPVFKAVSHTLNYFIWHSMDRLELSLKADHIEPCMMLLSKKLVAVDESSASECVSNADIFAIL